MIIAPPPGFTLDMPWVSPQPAWVGGRNIRFRLGLPESVGLHGPLRLLNGDQIVLPGAGTCRRILTTPSTTTGQIVAGSATTVTLLEFDPGSLPGTGTRWRLFDLTPVGMAAANDAVPNPSSGRVEIPPVWWFSPQNALVVGSRANVAGEPTYAWDRGSANKFTALAGSPTGAVGGCVIDGILVLLGATSFTDPDPTRFLTVRWSDRFDYEDWTPTDVNTAGEMQLEGGSRIVGGGWTQFGVTVWTDTRLAVLTETGDPNSVFARRYIDGSSGLIANNAWCEAGNRVWWYDTAKQLNVFDGGAPRVVPNPMRYATVERIDDTQFAYAYMEANTEYNEVILHYPSGDDNVPNRQLIYNYVEDAWYYWDFPRTAWAQRFGVIPTLGVDGAGAVFRHDLDASPQEPWLSDDLYGNSSRQTPFTADVVGKDFELMTNLITMEEVTSSSWEATKLLVDHLPAPAQGADDDTIEIELIAYGEPTRAGTRQSDVQTLVQGGGELDMRVGGKAVQLVLSGTAQKTVWRFGAITATPQKAGGR